MRAVPPVPVSRLRWLHTCADRLRARAGWKRALSAFAYGALASLAFAPTDVAPVLWVCFPALIFLVQGTKNWRGAFAAGWCFAFGFFTFDLYWIAASMFVDLHRFWWAVPLAVAGLPAFFALYYGIAAALARRLGLQGLTGAVSFALLWFLADYARGHLFTGFPWNIEGYAWAEILPVAQIVSMTGVYGLTLLTLLGACLPAALAEQPLRKSARESFLFSLVVLAGLTVWGSARLETATAAMVPGVRLRLVQPDIAESMKWDPA
ncbi:MAG TPA: apolipoprotein N-acyltransferase, partial [Alphaproteobacteria bacterium]|nr:apolipoprotein N-acyltransferase [Alphaproteobacteria bacterium]